jgi:prepilin-type N-terminal cleavage/methylation domain-containing protein
LRAMSVSGTNGEVEIKRMTKLECRMTKEAFTLIELLVVIAITVILMGLLFPAFRGVQDQAKKTQAKNDVTQIVTAVNAFYTEYGRYPTTANTDTSATYGPSGSDTENGDLFKELRGISNTLNTRQIVFISPPDAKDQTNPRSGTKTTTSGYYDPWGSEYAVALDADYDNQIANPYTSTSANAGPTTLRFGVIAWSLGKDQKQDADIKAGDDVISWQ